MIDHPTPGLALHLHYMHYNLDPSSSTYGTPPPHSNDDNDYEGRYQVAAHRTPDGRRARRAFLWRPFQCVDWVLPAEARSEPESLFLQADGAILYTDQLLQMSGEFLIRSIDHYDDHNMPHYCIASCPIWKEAASVYFQLASRIPHLRQVKVLAMTCMTTLPNPLVAHDALTLANKDIRAQLLSRPACSLKVTLGLVELRMKIGDDTAVNGPAGPETAVLALTMYISAIVTLLPWFPSEYHMAAWESRLAGISRLLYLCNVNIARILISSFNSFDTAYTVLDAVSSLTCITNSEKCGILELQAHCSIQAALHGAIMHQHQDPTAVEPSILDSSLLLAQREIFLQREPEDFASDPWVGDFSPVNFRQHHTALDQKLKGADYISIVEWGDFEGPMSTATMQLWMAQMKQKEATRLKERGWMGQASENRDDLKAENVRRERDGDEAECNQARWA